ncbi:MAG: tryptophan 7-halogenase [Dehalococcoidia bacterium]|nr:tryptophan 7-halogenase [Dehalococcoidia bacterium]
MIGDGYILVGDAACFVDPLFSSGVHLAMSSGVLASAYITSALKDPGIASAAAGVYKELYYQQYNQFRELARLFYASNRSVDSYFWEARRITGAGDELTPRQAFVRAVAGQPPKGYERAVLEQGELPADFADALEELEKARTERQNAFDHLLQESPRELLRSQPGPPTDAVLERKPVLTDGEFEWGDVVSTEQRPEGTPVSPLVATLFRQLDGQRTLGSILQELTAGAEGERRGALLQSALACAPDPLRRRRGNRHRRALTCSQAPVPGRIP